MNNICFREQLLQEVDRIYQDLLKAKMSIQMFYLDQISNFEMRPYLK